MDRDAAAIEAIRGGDTQRYGELVERYQRLVYGIAWSRLGDADLAEEAAQETFVQGFRYLGGLRRPERFAAWIARIARNMAQAIGRGRRRELSRRERWSLDELPSPTAAQAEDEPVGETLSQALSALPDAHRESLVLYYLQGNSVREAAALLGISEGAFKVRLHRARARLREAMEERLERSLQELSPRKGLRDRILAVLPAFPLGWGVGSAGLGSLVAALGWVLMTALCIAGLWCRYGDLARNFREKRGFRQTLLKREFVRLFVFLVFYVVIILTAPLQLPTFERRALWCAFGLWLLLDIARVARLVRVNPSPVALANLAVFYMWVAVMVAIALQNELSFRFSWAMLIMFPGPWVEIEDRPLRADYSLFVRAAHGGLGAARASVAPAGGIGMEGLRRFARFLGERFLAVDYSLRPAECTIYLPSVAPRAALRLNILPAPLSRGSTVAIGSDGTSRDHVNARDLRELRALDGGRQPDARELERRVSRAVEAALARFLAGDTEGAEALVQDQSDEAVFLKQPPHRTTRQSMILFATLLATLLLLGLLFLLNRNGG